MTPARLFATALAAITLVASGCSKPNDTNRPASDTNRPASEPAVGTTGVGGGGAGANLKDDDDFVRDVALKNLAAVELSRQALARASNAEVKSFAQKVVDDHNAAGEQLKAVVSTQPIDWPGQLDDKHRKAGEELASVSAADFDREYLKAMVKSHQDLAAKLESRLDVQSLATWKTAAAGRAESKAMPDPNRVLTDVQVRPAHSDNGVTMKINQWAADTYPVAQKHLDSARTLENATKPRST